jgi:hypothetical protein
VKVTRKIDVIGGNQLDILNSRSDGGGLVLAHRAGTGAHGISNGPDASDVVSIFFGISDGEQARSSTTSSVPTMHMHERAQKLGSCRMISVRSMASSKARG